MATMEKLQDRREQVARVAKRVRGEARRAGIRGKTFDQLTQREKDMLLKQVAVQLGLIEDSDDSDDS